MDDKENVHTKIAVLKNDMQHINQTLDRMEGKFDNAITGFVTMDKLADATAASYAKHAEQDRAIKKLEDWNAWAVRIVLGVVILAVLALIVGNQVIKGVHL